MADPNRAGLGDLEARGHPARQVSRRLPMGGNRQRRPLQEPLLLGGDHLVEAVRLHLHIQPQLWRHLTGNRRVSDAKRL